MKKLLLVFSALAVLAGCNTIAGIGQDVQKAGQTVEEAAKKK
jgi:predicted small secreted protein